MLNRKIVAVLALVALMTTAGISWAQSGTKSLPPKRKATFEERIWKYLESVCYDQWSPAGDTGDFRESEEPHGAIVKTYMNRTAAGSPKALRHGSMVIKENYSPDKKLMAITLMYKQKGYNPEAGDWYWVKFMPDGKVATMDTPKGKMAIAGKAQGCIDCHSNADGGDYSFFND